MLVFEDCAFLQRLNRDTCSVVQGSSCRTVGEGNSESGDCHCCDAPQLVAILTSPQPRQEELIWQHVNNLLDLQLGCLNNSLMLQTCCFILRYPCCAYVCDIRAGNKYLPKSKHNWGNYLGSAGLCTIDTRAVALNGSYYQTPLFTYFNAFPGFFFVF